MNNIDILTKCFLALGLPALINLKKHFEDEIPILCGPDALTQFFNNEDHV